MANEIATVDKVLLPITAESVLTRKQVKRYGPRTDAKLVEKYGKGAAITAEVRYDDKCGNGHNSFAITADVYTDRSRRMRDIEAGGCLHEDVAEYFPELSKFIKWHLCSSDGPMHYPGNVLYHAGNRDCWGRAAGEPSSWGYGVRFNDVPVTHRIKFQSFCTWLQSPGKSAGIGHYEIMGIQHPPADYAYSDNYTLKRGDDQYGGESVKWHECPFSDRTAAEEFAQAMNTCTVEFVKVATAWSEGKVRELDSARHCAVWPEATDEELSQSREELEKVLMARLPKLLEEFRRDVESLGFVW